MPITNTVYRQGETRFDMVGRSLGAPLHLTDQKISEGMLERLRKYANTRLTDLGLSKILVTWGCEVSTMDGDDTPSSRSYIVSWTSPEGAEIGVHGILTRKGYPFLDHGVFLQEA